MAKIEKFEDLEIWNKSREICIDIETLFETTNLGKRFSMKDQMDRSSGSIMDNIAEGFDRGSRLEFINSLGIAKGETGELKSQLYRCLDASYINQNIFNQLYEEVDEVARMIASFIEYLNKSGIKGQKFKNRQNGKTEN